MAADSSAPPAHTDQRVDAHHHVWDLAVRDEPWITGPEMEPINRTFALADLAPDASAAGVTQTVLVQTLSDLAETRDFLALAAASDLVGAVTGWVDLTSPSVADDLAALRAGTGRQPPAGHPARRPVRAGPGMAVPPRRPARSGRGGRRGPAATSS